MAALVLASQGKIDYNWFVFCDVGADSENPDTLRYLHEIAIPFAEKNNIRLDVIWKKKGAKRLAAMYKNVPKTEAEKEEEKEIDRAFLALTKSDEYESFVKKWREQDTLYQTIYTDSHKSLSKNEL